MTIPDDDLPDFYTTLAARLRPVSQTRLIAVTPSLSSWVSGAFLDPDMPHDEIHFVQFNPYRVHKLIGLTDPQ